MRLNPIEKPGSLALRFAYWWSRRQFGKVIMPMKLIYARRPKLMWIASKIFGYQEKAVSIDQSLVLLIQARVSMLNGCAFCNDLVLAEAVRKKLGAQKFFALGDGAEAKALGEKEQAAVDFVDEYAKERRVSDETFARLRRFFSDEEVIDIIAVNAFEQYFNAFAVPLEIESDGLRRTAEETAG